MATSADHKRGTEDECSTPLEGMEESIVELDITATAVGKPTKVDAGEHPEANCEQKEGKNGEDMNKIKNKGATCFKDNHVQ